MTEKELKKSRRKAFAEAVKREMREHKSSYWVFMVLRFLILVAAGRHLFLGNYENVFLCLVAMILLLVPSIFQVRFQIEIPKGLEITILCFIYAAVILGEINAFYISIPFWDTMLHTLNGFLCAAVGFSLVNLLNENENIALSLSPFYLAVVAFCFSMTVGVLWEFAECWADLFLGTDAQKDWIVQDFATVMLDETKTNIAVPVEGVTDVIVVYADGSSQALGLGGYLDIGLMDTMKDLFVNFIGAVVFSAFGYVHADGRGSRSMIKLFVLRKKQNWRERHPKNA